MAVRSSYPVPRLGMILWVLVVLLFGAATTVAAERQTVRVGYVPGYGISPVTGGNFTGYSYDYLQAVGRYTGWKYEFVPGNAEESLQRLARGEIDLFAPLRRTPKREKLFSFPDISIGHEYSMLYASSRNSKIFYNDIEGFKGMTVGIMRDMAYNDDFEKFRKAHGFSVTIREYATTVGLLQALKANEVDTIVAGGTMDVIGARLVANFSTDPFYLAVAPNRPDLLDTLNKALHTIRKEDIYLDARLYARYYSYRGMHQPAFTRNEARFVEDFRPLNVAVLETWPPLGYKKNGELQGIVPDIVKAMASYGRLRLNLLPVKNYEEAENALRSGRADILASYGSAQKTLFSQSLETTDEYLDVPLILMGRVDLTSTRKMRVALPEDFSLEEHVFENYPDAQIQYLPTFYDCLEAVRSGKSESTLVIAYLYDRYANASEFRNLTFLSVVDRPLKLSMGLSQALPPIAGNIIRKALCRITPREIGDIVFANTMREVRPPTIRELISQFATELLIGTTSLALLAGGIYIVIRLRIERQLWNMAYLDPLSGFGNWNKFGQDAANLRPRNAYAFVVIDIESFNLVNEHFGYTTGTRTLRIMANIIQAELRDHEIAARRDSDIFVMLLRFDDMESLRERLHALQQRISAMPPVSGEGEPRILHTACGVCLDERGPDGLISLNTLYDRANHARKSLKPLHESSCAFFDADMNARMLEEHYFEQHMEQALQNFEFIVHYQPKFAISNGEVVGSEALVRWQHPGRGEISPTEFISLFEKNGFILKLDMYVLEEVCKQLRGWLDAGLTPLPVAVNISKVHLHTAAFVHNVHAIVQRYDISPHLLELEITETAFFSNTGVLLDTLHELGDLGFTLSLDDFGSGYSSLNMLKNLPVQVLKIDRGFFDMEEDGERARKVIRSVIQMAQGLHMKVVAEGVETEDQVAFLREARCDFVQGFYFSRPLPVDRFEKLVFADARQDTAAK